MANLLIMATTFKSLKQREKELQEQMKALQADMIEEMHGQEKVTCGQYTISYKKIISNVIDTKRLKAERPDVAEEFTEERESNRFTVQ